MNNDLISREDLKRAIMDLPNDNPSYYYSGYLLDREKVLDEIDNAPTVEPRIEYGTDGQPYRLSMTGGRVVPDNLQGWRYEERPQGEWITRHKNNSFGQDVVCFECNKCGEYKLPIIHTMIVEPLGVCPNCGADMRKGGAE